MEVAAKAMGPATRMDRTRVWEHRRKKESARRRKLSQQYIAARPPALAIKSPAIGKTAIRWYCGTFPILPNTVTLVDQQKYSQLRRILRKSITLQMCEAKQRDDAKKALDELKNCINYGSHSQQSHASNWHEKKAKKGRHGEGSGKNPPTRTQTSNAAGNWKTYTVRRNNNPR